MSVVEIPIDCGTLRCSYGIVFSFDPDEFVGKTINSAPLDTTPSTHHSQSTLPFGAGSPTSHSTVSLQRASLRHRRHVAGRSGNERAVRITRANRNSSNHGVPVGLRRPPTATCKTDPARPASVVSSGGWLHPAMQMSCDIANFFRTCSGFVLQTFAAQMHDMEQVLEANPVLRPELHKYPCICLARLEADCACASGGHHKQGPLHHCDHLKVRRMGPPIPRHLIAAVLSLNHYGGFAYGFDTTGRRLRQRRQPSCPP